MRISLKRQASFDRRCNVMRQSSRQQKDALLKSANAKNAKPLSIIIVILLRLYLLQVILRNLYLVYSQYYGAHNRIYHGICRSYFYPNSLYLFFSKKNFNFEFAHLKFTRSLSSVSPILIDKQ